MEGYKGWIPVEECFSKIENAAGKRFEIVFKIRQGYPNQEPNGSYRHPITI